MLTFVENVPIIDKDARMNILAIEGKKKIVNDFSFDFCIYTIVIFYKTRINRSCSRMERRRGYVENT